MESFIKATSFSLSSSPSFVTSTSQKASNFKKESSIPRRFPSLDTIKRCSRNLTVWKASFKASKKSPLMYLFFNSEIRAGSAASLNWLGSEVGIHLDSRLGGDADGGASGERKNERKAEVCFLRAIQFLGGRLQEMIIYLNIWINHLSYWITFIEDNLQPFW